MSLILDGEAYHCNEFHSEILQRKSEVCYFIYILIIANTRVGTLIVATIYLQLIQNRYRFRSFTVLQCSHQHCVQPIASDVEVVGYL